ncbi:glycosyltransferase family 2 protein [Aphanothece hegewaldii CCALA 016]|uniref:Glycosyltransferase family 2 protein n=1 Tax=Aphanothece hegewaldii CCALA 016 TaxID=2107694 RepID=A0A2T1LX32_9CHRO|nr:glycosyltransferase family 2 protein [Aphanothece hegewaldii]PSF36752.1 glycosyltransferase family 2 protein [Aphanothece hegewaldii CCALA 016]
MYKILAYITAYKDRESIDRCILSIKNQSFSVDNIFVVDNSPQCLLSKKLDEKLIIKSYPENIGISRGLKIGLQWAIAHQYNFLWTFDQDSQPDPDTLEKLLETYNLIDTRKNIGIIAPLPVDKITGQEWHGINFDGYRFRENVNHELTESYYYCDSVITSGSLISIAAAKQVPLPNENFFIDAVDWEYCWKFRQEGFDIVVAKDITLNHRFGNSKQIKIFPFKKLITIYNYSPLRYYYIHRNYTYLETRLANKNNKLIFSILRRLQFLLILTIKIALFEHDLTLLKLWACLRGTYDGFRGELGKSWQ